MIERRTFSLGAAFLASWLTWGVMAGTAAADELLDRIVAVVNDDVVLLSELRREAEQLVAQVQQANVAMPPESVIVRQALERLILSKLQLAEAARLGLTVEEDTLAQALGNIARNNGLTLAELREAIVRDGMSFEAFREDLRAQILLTRLRNQEVVNRIQVTDAEVEQYLARGSDRPGGRTEFHLLHLLIATPDGASPREIDNARSRAEQLLEQLRNGMDFRALAQQHSDGRQALSGGDLGWLKAEEVPTLFTDAVATLERGGVAGPLRSASGYHIVKLEDYKGGDLAIIAQTHAQHILIRTDELTSDAEASDRLARLRERILSGEDFATLARSHSDDRASAIRGGDLGWVSPGATVPRFEEEMAALGTGEISQPFKTDFGWHIVQVLDRRQHDATDEVMRSRAREVLRERKAEEAMELYLRRLRDEAYVELMVEDMAR